MISKKAIRSMTNEEIDKWLNSEDFSGKVKRELTIEVERRRRKRNVEV